MPEDEIKSESFTVTSIDSLLVYENKYYQQVYLVNCSLELQTNKWQIILMTIFLKIRYYKCCITIELISEGIDPTKSNKSKECTIYHY